MCEECQKLKENFHNAESIIERQTLYNIYDKQRKKCNKALGSLAPVPKPAEIKKERKPRKKKEQKPEPDDDVDDAPTPPAPAKKQKPALAEKHGESPRCKYYYRGGLCANSKMEKPFCVGEDKCPPEKR